MFTSPCSLRSPACAALIALATAAGLSRFEPAPGKPVQPETAKSETSTGTTRTRSHAQIYPAAFAVLPPQPCASHARLTISTDDATGAATARLVLAPDEAWPPAPPVATVSNFFFNWTAAMPTVREHSHPFAVGPPHRAIDEQKLRAAGLARPGDSPARRSQVSRIARVFISSSRASLTRRAQISPSPALRGGPEFPLRLIPRARSSRRSAAKTDAHFSP